MKPQKQKVGNKLQNLPSTFELTQITALLAGKSLPQDDSKLAQRAFQLWKACEQQLSCEILLPLIEAGHFSVVSTGIRGIHGESPKSWPCSFDEALRLLMPKKRTRGDRYVRFRSFLKDVIQVPTPAKRHSTKGSGLQHKAQSEKKTLDEIEAVFKAFKLLGFKNYDDYVFWLKPFSAWLTVHEAKEMSAQRSIAAKARWAKKAAGVEIQAGKEKSRVS
jgi:hypothetical protein